MPCIIPVKSLAAIFVVFMVDACAVVAGAVQLSRHALPLWPLFVWITAINLLAFEAFRRDKAAAQDLRFRISESRLLILCLLGGALGGVTASRLYHHKTAKLSFRLKFWFTVATHGMAACLLFRFS